MRGEDLPSFEEQLAQLQRRPYSAIDERDSADEDQPGCIVEAQTDVDEDHVARHDLAAFRRDAQEEREETNARSAV